MATLLYNVFSAASTLPPPVVKSVIEGSIVSICVMRCVTAVRTSWLTGRLTTSLHNIGRTFVVTNPLLCIVQLRLN